MAMFDLHTKYIIFYTILLSFIFIRILLAIGADKAL